MFNRRFLQTKKFRQKVSNYRESDFVCRADWGEKVFGKIIKSFKKNLCSDNIFIATY